MNTLPKFSELPPAPTTATAAQYLRLVQYDPNHGHYVPLGVLERIATEPNAAELELEVFWVLCERNAAVHEKYRRDR